MSSSYYSSTAYNQTPSATYTPTPTTTFSSATTYTPSTFASTSGNTPTSSYANYPNYSAGYTSTVPGTSQYSNFQSYYAQQHHQQRNSPPPYEPPPPPDYTSINPRVAAKSVHRLIWAQLRNAGFEGCEQGAVNRLEREVVDFVERLYESAHELANLANRSGPIVTDLLLACKGEGLEIEQLRKMTALNKKVKKRKQAGSDTVKPATLALAPASDPSPDLLHSDDEETGYVVPITLRGLTHYAPALPPKHTYLRTPVSPLKKAALPSLEKKLKNAALVQESLKNLMLATEDNPDDEDGELLGSIVNGQAIGYQRKRWKLSA